jgi:Cu-processing system permease protein
MQNAPLQQHILIAWKLGTRSRAIRGLLAFGILLLVIAFLSGAFSLRQPLVVTLDIGISGIRLLTALLTLFWMQEAFMRDIERRTITVAFGLPVARHNYVLGRFIGVMLLISAVVLCWGLALALAAQFAHWGYPNSSRPYLDWRYALVMLGILIDAWTIGAFVLAITSVAETPLLPFMVGAGFALAARSIGPVLDYLAFSASADPALKANFLGLVDALRWLLPDLSQLDWRTSVLYDAPISLSHIAAALSLATGYTLCFLTIAVIAYRKRELN